MDKSLDEIISGERPARGGGGGVKVTPQSKHKVVCFNCGIPGHKTGDCTRQKTGDYVTCYQCGAVGHKSGECPQLRAGGGRGSGKGAGRGAGYGAGFGAGYGAGGGAGYDAGYGAGYACFTCGEPGHR